MLNNAAGSAGCVNSLTTSAPSTVGKLHESTGFEDAPARPVSPTNVKLAVAGPFDAGADVVVLSIVVVGGAEVAAAVIATLVVELTIEGAVVEAVELLELLELPHDVAITTTGTTSRQILPTSEA
jgi:hypothetical protein